MINVSTVFLVSLRCLLLFIGAFAGLCYYSGVSRTSPARPSEKMLPVWVSQQEHLMSSKIHHHIELVKFKTPAAVILPRTDGCDNAQALVTVKLSHPSCSLDKAIPDT